MSKKIRRRQITLLLSESTMAAIEAAALCAAHEPHHDCSACVQQQLHRIVMQHATVFSVYILTVI